MSQVARKAAPPKIRAQTTSKTNLEILFMVILVNANALEGHSKPL